MGRPKKYITTEEQKKANCLRQARWYSRNKEKVSEYKRLYYKKIKSV